MHSQLIFNASLKRVYQLHDFILGELVGLCRLHGAIPLSRAAINLLSFGLQIASELQELIPGFLEGLLELGEAVVVGGVELIDAENIVLEAVSNVSEAVPDGQEQVVEVDQGVLILLSLNLVGVTSSWYKLLLIRPNDSCSSAKRSTTV
jgi:hypothetical protein